MSLLGLRAVLRNRSRDAIAVGAFVSEGLRGRRYLAAAAALLLTVPMAAWAQEGEDSDRLFVDRVDVNVINVEVFVNDRQGRAVSGLTQDDFEILEDGRPVEISNFYTVSRGDRVLQGFERDRVLVSGDDTGSAAPVELPTAIPVPEDQQLNLVVYVDFFNLRPASRKRVLDDMGGFLEDRLNQGDNVMLVGFSKSLDVVQPFTQDRELLARGLDKMRRASTYRQVDIANRRRVMRNMTIDFREGDPSSAFQQLRSYVQGARDDLRRSIRGVEQMVRSLAGLPGRKAVLYVSEGLPQRPGEDLYEHLRNLAGPNAGIAGSGGSLIDPSIEALRQDESALFNSITREANAHQVTLYTVDARGYLGDSTLSAEYSELAAGASGRAALDAIRTASYQEPLIELAETTGGTSVLSTLNFDDAMDNLAGDFDTFYSLGYSSPRGGDGKYHKIEVRVKRPGLKVRHRSGYVDKPEAERVADRTLSSLLLDVEKNPLGISVDFGDAEKDGRKTYLLPVLVRVPFRELTLLPNGETEEGRLKIFLVVRDEEGGISDLHEFPYPISIPQTAAEAARGQELGYRTTLKLRSGTPKVVVGVWDELSGVESFVAKKVLVGEQGKKRKNRRGR